MNKWILLGLAGVAVAAAFPVARYLDLRTACPQVPGLMLQVDQIERNAKASDPWSMRTEEASIKAATAAQSHLPSYAARCAYVTRKQLFQCNFCRNCKTTLRL